MRLIDADSLKARIIEEVPGFLGGGSSITKAFILAMLETRNATPTIDAVPVVRCKDCKHRGNSEKCVLSAISDEKDFPLFMLDNRGDWFCADGERIEKTNCSEYPNGSQEGR